MDGFSARRRTIQQVANASDVIIHQAVVKNKRPPFPNQTQKPDALTITSKIKTTTSARHFNHHSKFKKWRANQARPSATYQREWNKTEPKA
jgi:hypothetical protein